MDAGQTQNEADAGAMSGGSQSSDSGCMTAPAPEENAPLWSLLLGGLFCWARIRRRIRRERTAESPGA